MAGPLKNPRHEAFAHGLVKGMTADAAYAKAGYKPNRHNAARLTTNEHVKARVAELLSKAEARTGVTLDRVLREYERIAFSGMSKFLRVNKDGDPIIDLSACTPEDLDLLAETTLEDFTEGRGKDARDVRRIKIKTLDRMRALEALGKHLGMGDKAKNETTDRLTEALMQINARGSAAPIATAARLAAAQQNEE
ncbi:terminase small subunit [Pararhodobacter sp.]|uniref:terminase small subunit n=1 Tax=Pararhodobacter sp. TaxID=2127056 RepID=UPI002FDD7AA5